MAFLDVRGMDELKAAGLLFQRADTETRKAIRQESAKWAPELRRAIHARARTKVHRVIADTAKVTTTTKGIVAVIGSTGRLSSGDPVSKVTRPWEFGTGQPQQKGKYLTRSPNRKAYWVERRVQRQVPRLNRDGHMVYQAVADVTPTLVARYVRAVAEAVTRG